jgi:hypothetical protein
VESSPDSKVVPLHNGIKRENDFLLSEVIKLQGSMLEQAQAAYALAKQIEQNLERSRRAYPASRVPPFL